MVDQQPPENLALALDRCVKCGLCLPECPTYRLSRNENESPRGRLALLEGLIQGQLAADPTVQRHLDTCLLCRRCERICPSGVAFGAIMDRAKAELLPSKPTPWYQQLVTHPNRLRTATLFARLSPPWLSKPIPRLHRQHRLARALYAEAPPVPGRYPAAGPARGRVGLFSGCATAAQQGGVLVAALRFLTYAGFEVIVPGDAGCCGALAAHTGDTETARALAERNRVAFAGELDAVVSVASGCGVHLQAYRPPLPVPHSDICQFLVEHAGLTPAAFAPRHQHALLHTPCTVENVYRGGEWSAQLLALVPSLRVSQIGETGQCCGAAGDYLLRHPTRADTLRRPLLEAVIDSDADVVLTSNVGCAMHLAAGLAMYRQRVEVLHPVELLARQLIERAPASYTEALNTEYPRDLTGQTT